MLASTARLEAIHDPKERILKLQSGYIYVLPETGSNPRSERADIETLYGHVLAESVTGEAIHDPKERILKLSAALSIVGRAVSKQSTIRKSGY